MATKKVGINPQPPNPLYVLVGSEIGDPRSGIRYGRISGSGINIPDPQH
jgi:hypothetical protein